MSLKVGDSVAWSVGSALRTGQYIGKHQYRLKQEKAPKKVIEAASDDDIRAVASDTMAQYLSAIQRTKK